MFSVVFQGLSGVGWVTTDNAWLGGLVSCGCCGHEVDMAVATCPCGRCELPAISRVTPEIARAQTFATQKDLASFATFDFWGHKAQHRISKMLIPQFGQSEMPSTTQQTRIYPYPMVWPLAGPWSQTMGLNPPLSAVNPMLKGFSVSGALFFGFGRADPAPKGSG